MYLPQFHPIPENDRWWGEGFTEWTNVRKALPRFLDHYQPHVPGELGYYDLRDSAVRKAQADLAQEFGISAFCYYHYWFNGKMLLERPFNEVLGSGSPDLPFCLCWANENWTRRWDGKDREVLMGQDYDVYDPVTHITWLERAFADNRYLRIDGKPLFLVYRPDAIPLLKEKVKIWRAYVEDKGYKGLYLCGVRNMQHQLDEGICLESGFDALMDFQPNSRDVSAAHTSNDQSNIDKLYKFFVNVLVYVNPDLQKFARCSYDKIVSWMLNRELPQQKIFPCVFPSWDNSARRKTGATIIQNMDPELFGMWLFRACEQVAEYAPDERLVFINAWNEWAEGCHLEPDSLNGRKFLEMVCKTLLKFQCDY